MALPQQVVMIDQVTLIGKERKRGERPGGGHQSPGPEDGCPTTWLGTIFHISDLGDTQRTPPVPRYLPLRFEVEVALNGVAPAELPDHAILWDVHAVARRLSKVGWRNRNGAEDVEDGFPLLWRCLVLDVKHGPPVARQHIAGNLIDLDKREVRDIHAPHSTPINVVGIDRVAATTVWVVAHPAGAWSPAGTGLQEGPI